MPLIEDGRQGQRLRPQLHAADSHRIRGLQPMPPLYPPLAVVAAAHSDIETAHDGPPDNVFLILRLTAFRLHAAAAVRAALRHWNRNPFIHARRHGTARLPAGAAARLTAWPLWVGLWCAARMRRGLTPAGTQRCFQFPAQTFGFLFQALDLFAQPLVFLLRSIQLSFRNKLHALRLLVCGRPANWSQPTLRYPKPYLLFSKIGSPQESDKAPVFIGFGEGERSAGRAETLRPQSTKAKKDGGLAPLHQGLGFQQCRRGLCRGVHQPTFRYWLWLHSAALALGPPRADGGMIHADQASAL
jgi:hypothetical protein